MIAKGTIFPSKLSLTSSEWPIQNNDFRKHKEANSRTQLVKGPTPKHLRFYHMYELNILTPFTKLYEEGIPLCAQTNPQYTPGETCRNTRVATAVHPPGSPPYKSNTPVAPHRAQYSPSLLRQTSPFACRGHRLAASTRTMTAHRDHHRCRHRHACVDRCRRGRGPLEPLRRCLLDRREGVCGRR